MISANLYFKWFWNTALKRDAHKVRFLLFFKKQQVYFVFTLEGFITPGAMLFLTCNKRCFSESWRALQSTASVVTEPQGEENGEIT